MEKQDLIEKIKGGLIVSCQALEHEPMYSDKGGVMPLFAKAAYQAGAVGIRANTVRDIQEIKAVVDLPIIGIIKKDYPDSPQYITATMAEIDALAKCPCDIIAFDCTNRVRADHRSLETFIHDIKEKYPTMVLMADIATYEEGKRAFELGVDFVGTTLCGYTQESKDAPVPDYTLVSKLSALGIPVIGEGHVDTPEKAVKMLEAGALCVVVGSAITRPYEIAKQFVEGIKGKENL